MFKFIYFCNIEILFLKISANHYFKYKKSSEFIQFSKTFVVFQNHSHKNVKSKKKRLNRPLSCFLTKMVNFLFSISKFTFHYKITQKTSIFIH